MSTPSTSQSSKKDLPNKRERLIMSVILEHEKYGLEILKEVKAKMSRTRRAFFTLAQLYFILDKLEKKGLIQGRFGETIPARQGLRRRYYKVTAKGWEALQDGGDSSTSC